MELTVKDELQINQVLKERLNRLNRKIIVLDDDPTGTQTVNQVDVYTEWGKDTILEAFKDENKMFFVLTNSRSFSKKETVRVHKTIAKNIVESANLTGTQFLIISRGDSTLRGHYPIETESLRQSIEKASKYCYDGEIIIPFFEEGGRRTIDDIHYVETEDGLIPVGKTEFAKDKTFGFKSSNLLEWCEEKTSYQYKASEMITFSLEELRKLDYAAVTRKLMSVEGFNKVIVNASNLMDLKIFTIGLIDALLEGKTFMFRTAASFVKVIGGVEDRPLLGKEEIVVKNTLNGGLIVVGSHVQKTTSQLEALRASNLKLEYIEFDVNVIYSEKETKKEIDRIVTLLESHMQLGKDSVLYTSRKLIHTHTDNKEDILKISTDISNAITTIIKQLQVQPKFIIAKGGITSSDVATKGLQVKKAWVLGQVAKGIPVWKLGPESKFNDMAYIVFPGNVGESATLKEIVERLCK